MAQYHIARDGAQLGTFADTDVLAGLSTGRFLPDDLVWTEGMGDWQPVKARFQLPAPGAASPVIVGGGPYNPYAAPVANVMPPTTADNLELASLGKRFGAAMLDGVSQALLIWAPYFYLIAQLETNKTLGDDGINAAAMWAAGAMMLGILILGTINIIMLTTRGQTIGKRLLGIRIVSHPEGHKPGFVKAVLLRAVVNTIITIIPCLGGIYSLVDICFIFQQDRRCIHDQIAGTQVVEGNPPA